MKITSFLLFFSLHFAIWFSGCKKNKADETGNKQKGLVGLSLYIYQNSSPGLAGHLESIDYITSKGVNLFGMAYEWPQLEADFTGLSNPLTLLDPGKTKFKTYILILKMIDTNRETLPSDLSGKSFSDTAVINRFLRLIDTISTFQSIDRVSHILLGNEVDGYLTSHPSELNPFAVFYQQAVSHIHQKIPGAKVGTIITFNAAASNVFNKLIPYSDFVCYTYYPTVDQNGLQWQMRPPSDVVKDIAFMAQRSGDKPFAFTEIGYSSSVDNNSSESLQKQFVEKMFETLEPYKNKGKIDFLYYHGLYDYPPGSCGPYALSQGVDSTYLCGFMNNLGLNRYSTGQPKQAWNSFVEKMRNW
jgi:hypothetical protein